MSNFLPLDSIRDLVPSIFSETAAPTVSSRYRFLSTFASIVQPMLDRGYGITQAKQTSARNPYGRTYAQHFIRFRHENPDIFGEYIPEVAYWGSHDRTRAGKFIAGCFRGICYNGMISWVPGTDESGQFSFRHTGGTDLDMWTDKIRASIVGTVDRSTQHAMRMDAWKRVSIPSVVATSYAEAVAEAIGYTPRPERLLFRRRSEDRPNTLAGVVDIVQENALKGGEQIQAKSGRRSATRPVKAIAKNVEINQIVDRLAQTVAKAIGV